jgi:hypothetical protein
MKHRIHVRKQLIGFKKLVSRENQAEKIDYLLVFIFHNFCRVFVSRINKILTPNNIEISQAHALNLQIV